MILLFYILFIVIYTQRSSIKRSFLLIPLYLNYIYMFFNSILFIAIYIILIIIEFNFRSCLFFITTIYCNKKYKFKAVFFMFILFYCFFEKIMFQLIDKYFILCHN